MQNGRPTAILRKWIQRPLSGSGTLQQTTWNHWLLAVDTPNLQHEFRSRWHIAKHQKHKNPPDFGGICAFCGAFQCKNYPSKTPFSALFAKKCKGFAKAKIWYHIVNQLDARKLCIFAFLHSCICTVFVMEAMSSPCKNIPADCFYNWWHSLCIIAEWKGEFELAPYPFSAAFCRVFSLALAFVLRLFLLFLPFVP